MMTSTRKHETQRRNPVVAFVARCAPMTFPRPFTSDETNTGSPP
jgi:hypothetical protein